MKASLGKTVDGATPPGVPLDKLVRWRACKQAHPRPILRRRSGAKGGSGTTPTVDVSGRGRSSKPTENCDVINQVHVINPYGTNSLVNP